MVPLVRVIVASRLGKTTPVRRWRCNRIQQLSGPSTDANVWLMFQFVRSGELGTGIGVGVGDGMGSNVGWVGEDDVFPPHEATSMASISVTTWRRSSLMPHNLARTQPSGCSESNRVVPGTQVTVHPGDAGRRLFSSRPKYTSRAAASAPQNKCASITFERDRRPTV